jgi:predicted acyltransferase
VTGALLALAGIALNPVYPINKKIWTPSYTLLADGFCLAALALLHWLLDHESRSQFLEKLALPARVFGTNAILAFGFTTIANSLAPRIFLSTLGGERVNLPACAYDTFARFLAPNNASLLYALLFVCLNLLLVGLFYRKRIFLKL